MGIFSIFKNVIAGKWVIVESSRGDAGGYRLFIEDQKSMHFKRKCSIGWPSKSLSIRDEEQISIGNGSGISSYSNINLHYPGDGAMPKHSYTGRLIVGENTSIGGGLKVDAYTDIVIGNNCLLACDIYIFTHQHGHDPSLDIPYVEQPFHEPQKVVISDDVWIGERCIIFPGVTIGRKSIIGAGSVVTKNIPEYSIAAGNPAKVIKQWNFDKKEWVRV